MRAIAYADDLTMVFSARDSPQLEEKLACTMEKVKRWFERTGLRVALEKTEVILLAGQRNSKIRDFDVLVTPITSSEAVRYLGITMDCRINFRCHLQGAAARGDKLMGALASLLLNISGPSVHARRLYYSVWKSIVLYAAPVWSSALDIEVNRSILRRSQRSALIRTTTAYKTVAYQALCVLAGRLPIHLKVRMWKTVFANRKADRANPELRRNAAVLAERSAECKK